MRNYITQVTDFMNGMLSVTLTVTILALMTSSQSMYSQTDITADKIMNFEFDSLFNYKTGESGDVTQTINDVWGWTRDFSSTYSVTGVFQYGTGCTINGCSIPATGYGGGSGGGLAVNIGWSGTAKYYQKATLEEGRYALVTAYYNCSSNTDGRSAMGWIPDNGTSAMSSVSKFVSKTWTVDTVFFSVYETSSGKIQLGMKAGGGTSTNSARVVFDFVHLISYGIDKHELVTYIDMATNLYGDGSGQEATALKMVLDRAVAVNGNSDARLKEVEEITSELKQAVWNYHLLNASPDNPMDFNTYLTNPDFEQNGLDGWTGKNMKAQTNSQFSLKHGTAYVEKWVSRGSLAGSGSLSQTVTLPNGIYIIKAAALNVQQESSSVVQTGAWLFGNENETPISLIGDYALTFTNIDNAVTVGINVVNATGNWVACDNFRLYYAGGTTSDYAAELLRRAGAAEELVALHMQNIVQTSLLAAISAAKSTAANIDGTLVSIAQELKVAVAAAKSSVSAYTKWLAAITTARKVYGESSLEGAPTFLSKIESAQQAYDTRECNEDEVAGWIGLLDKATLEYRLSGGKGVVPNVVTHEYVAKGATVALGRSTISGTATSNLLEHGFCWSTDPNPTVLDNRSSRYFNHNGYIYVMENLEPSTIYYMRAYAMTKNYQVGYGKTVKVITIPKGTITYKIRSDATGDHYTRINEAIGSSVGYWNKTTSIQGLHVDAGYQGSGTANGGYGGWIGFGPAGYQQVGTAMHEMGHNIGIGTHSVYNGNALKGNGNYYWKGERANAVVAFIENNDNVKMYGDKVHIWEKDPTGSASNLIQCTFNGPQYYTQAVSAGTLELTCLTGGLMVQGLGEDGLPLTSGFASPAYTFGQEDTIKYYIKNEDTSRGMKTSYLCMTRLGKLVWQEFGGAENVLSNDSAAWYITFNPKNCYYTVRNAATKRYITYSGNSFALVAKSSVTSAEYLQLMRGRVDTEVGDAETHFAGRGYWFVHPEKKTNPQCMYAVSGGNVGSTTFNLGDEATIQRWLILSKDEVNLLEAAVEAENSLIVSNIAVNGNGISRFDPTQHDYNLPVNPSAEASAYIVTATKSERYQGELIVTQAKTIPGSAKIEAVSNGKVDAMYYVNLMPNYLYRWDAGGATGEGSAPSDNCWSTAGTKVTWTEANAASGCRYADPGYREYTSYTFNGDAFDQSRILWIRFNNNDEFRYAFSGLTAGHTYEFSFKYGWHNNGAAPKLTVAICSEDGTVLQDGVVSASSTKRVMSEGAFNVSVPAGETSRQFYVAITNNANNDCMVSVSDFSLVDADVLTEIEEVQSSEYRTHSNGIYSLSGQKLNNTGNLEKGIYIINGKKVFKR